MGFDFKYFLRAKGISCLYYMCPNEHLVSILKDGIRSRNWVKSKGLLKSDISGSEFQANRSIFSIFDQIEIHDYVPLYFVADTPMFYLKCVGDPGRDKVVIIKVNLEVMDLINKKKGYFTEANYASNLGALHQNLSSLDELHWDIIMGGPAYKPPWKSYKAAEVLIQDHIPIRYISEVQYHFQNEYVSDNITSISKYRVKIKENNPIFR